MEWDASRAVPMAIGGSIAPRTDIREEEGCFAALNVGGQRAFGRLQKFKDGSWGYWKMPREQAKQAPTLEEAFKRLATTFLGTTSPIACPRCGEPSMEPADPEQAAAEHKAIANEQPIKCRKCGAQISTKHHNPPDPPRVDG